jgi:hypothetical protein
MGQGATSLVIRRFSLSNGRVPAKMRAGILQSKCACNPAFLDRSACTKQLAAEEGVLPLLSVDRKLAIEIE